LIETHIPIVEGFKFTDEIKKKSFGIAYPQLVFHDFEVVRDHDPFYIPKTLEDMEDHGQGDILDDNIAKKLIEKIRTQKGMSTSKAIEAKMRIMSVKK